MKVIIAGSRDIFDITPVKRAYAESGFRATEFVSGACPDGVDQLGEELARSLGFEPKTFPADWTRLGHSAGPIRNRQMAEYADALVLIWDGESTGSASMKREAMAAGLLFYEWIV